MPRKNNREYIHLFLKISWLAQKEQVFVHFFGSSCSRRKTERSKLTIFMKAVFRISSPLPIFLGFPMVNLSLQKYK